MKSSKHSFGWRPSLPDHRDHKFTELLAPAALPAFVDLRRNFPTCYNQQQLGSCVSNAVAGAIEFDLIKQHLPIFIPSRLYIYYNIRVIENTVDSDAGGTLADGVKAVNKWGAPPEKEWPYNVTQFAVKPSTQAYVDGLKTRAVSYQSINQDATDLQSCLAGGYGFVFGFSVYDSFESDAVAATGIMPMPGVNEESLGGHAIVGVGYNNGPNTINGVPPRTFIARNSWGGSWGASDMKGTGHRGYFFMPYEYILSDSLASDFWKITVVL